ncbi:hypothetical protein TWF788_006839 [Orbilia oligospora]|uniref:CMP/dCMP-type deaminase domain-containing protein n=1 Tax=Orbilia oligospora TaxID=2813651 RepID=A0A7C8PUR7_ORBOL|nr:hypothetical protein TWF788_006839 [Orbilia oligospora]
MRLRPEFCIFEVSTRNFTAYFDHKTSLIGVRKQSTLPSTMQKILGYLTGLLSLQSTTGTSRTSTPSITDLDWKFMRASISALPSPCYRQAFGSVIVNATSKELLCTGFNKEDSSADPTEHGEVDAIRNCVKKFKDEGYSVDEIDAIWKSAWIYTTAEPCAMCGATILHAGFQRVIYATSSPGLYSMGWTKYLTVYLTGSSIETLNVRWVVIGNMANAWRITHRYASDSTSSEKEMLLCK